MPVNNPDGNNQHGEKNYPPDEKLAAALLQYAKEKLSVANRLVRLEAEFGLKIGKTTLNNLNNKFNVPSPRKLPAPEVVDSLVLESLELDRNGLRGIMSISSELQSRGIIIPRDRIRDVLRTHAIEGLLKRFPGGAKAAQPRKSLLSAGPNEMHHADGWEKLGLQALGIGVGIPAYGYTDQCSSKRLYLVVVPNSRLQDVIVHVHLDYIQHIGGIAVTHVVDKGSELGLAMQIQREMRALLAPDLDEDQYPPFVQLRSVHNTPAEGGWHWLRNFDGYNMRDDILDGADRFNAADSIQFCLFYWIWPPIIQARLDQWVESWNIKKIRPQKEKLNPSGHTPTHVYAVPQALGLLDLKIHVPQDLIDFYRARCHLTREQALSFSSESFSQAAVIAHEELHSPEITSGTAWQVFFAMLPPLRRLYAGREPEKAFIFNLP